MIIKTPNEYSSVRGREHLFEFTVISLVHVIKCCTKTTLLIYKHSCVNNG